MLKISEKMVSHLVPPLTDSKRQGYFEVVLATQGRRGTCKVGWAKLNDFPIKFETFIFTNSKSSTILLRSINISEYPTILKTLKPCSMPSSLKPQFKVLES